MKDTLFDKTPLESAIHALKKDILEAGGPQISTMRNYRFAILPYDPQEEFELRSHIRRLSDELKSLGWNALSISLQQIFLDRLHSDDPNVIDSIINRERRLFKKDPERALKYLKDEMYLYFEEPDGIAGAVVHRIDSFFETHSDQISRTLIFLCRLGALYPFFRASSLLKYIDGKTRNIPVVLLYPGERRDISALSFMGELQADRDYRPRIYS